MRFVDADEIRRVLTFPKLVAGMEAAHRRRKIDVVDASLGDEAGHYFVRHAVDSGRLMASKMFTSFPQNLAKNIPAVQAVCVVFDGANGTPLAVLDGTEITYWRTAADSAHGAKTLSRENASTLLVIGAGGMSRRLVHAHRSVRPSLQRVLVWNRTAERAEEVANDLKRDGIEAVAVPDLDAATREADIITACTRSHQPLIKGANLKAGTHLDLVGGYTPQTREADDEAAKRSLIFVDRREPAFHVGDIVQPIASGAIKETDVLGDLYDLASGAMKGRRSADDITFFKNAGGGHLDLMTCEVVLRELQILK
ncbi:MAG: dehydrogenase [Afipia sp.]|nr:dehydrogenase [Afipia sp.]